jgi:hypothetical protein
MKQTAVEWAINEIRSNWYDYEYGDLDIDDVIKQAKEMEKEQMALCYKVGVIDGSNGVMFNFDKYYKETFKTESNEPV